MEHSGGQENLYYTHCDYQGNLLAVTDVGGTVKERYAYDAWGLRRNPSNWTKTDTRISFLFSRGYTLHEHLDDFGLINMNGRVYDPLMAQFLSPDPYIQSPGSWLNYNRYAYGFNNPLIYTDPDGEWIVPVIGLIVGAYFGGTASNNWEWNPGKWDNSASTWMSTIMGGVAVAVGGSYLFGTNGVFAGGTSLNISLGLNINNIAAPVANFVVSNGGVALKGLGYLTAAGGGAMFVSSNFNNSLKNVYEGIESARESVKNYWRNSDFYFEHDLQTSIGVQAGFGVDINDYKARVNLNLASIDLFAYNGRQVGDDSSPWNHKGRWIGKDGYSTVRQSIQIPFWGYEHSFNSKGEGYIYGSEKHAFNILGVEPDRGMGDYGIKMGVDAKFIFGISYYVKFGRKRK